MKAKEFINLYNNCVYCQRPLNVVMSLTGNLFDSRTHKSVHTTQNFFLKEKEPMMIFSDKLGGPISFIFTGSEILNGVDYGELESAQMRGFCPLRCFEFMSNKSDNFDFKLSIETISVSSYSIFNDYDINSTIIETFKNNITPASVVNVPNIIPLTYWNLKNNKIMDKRIQNVMLLK